MRDREKPSLIGEWMRFWLNWGAGLVASMIAVPALAAGQQPIDAESMEVFFDRVWEESLSHDGVVPGAVITVCLLYTSPSPRDATLSRMPWSA